jgi:hypothetical protein
MPSRIIAALAPARVASYKSFLKLDTADQIHGAYCWNYELVASIFPLIGAVEALLRDSVHAAFANKMAPPGYQNPGAYPWFDPGMNPHQNLNGESLRQVQKLLFQPASSQSSAAQCRRRGGWLNVWILGDHVQVDQAFRGTTIDFTHLSGASPEKCFPVGCAS